MMSGDADFFHFEDGEDPEMTPVAGDPLGTPRRRVISAVELRPYTLDDDTPTKPSSRPPPPSLEGVHASIEETVRIIPPQPKVPDVRELEDIDVDFVEWENRVPPAQAILPARSFTPLLVLALAIVAIGFSAVLYLKGLHP